MKNSSILRRNLSILSHFTLVVIIIVLGITLINSLENRTYLVVTIFISTIILSNLLAKLYILLFLND